MFCELCTLGIHNLGKHVFFGCFFFLFAAISCRNKNHVVNVRRLAYLNLKTFMCLKANYIRCLMSWSPLIMLHPNFIFGTTHFTMHHFYILIFKISCTKILIHWGDYLIWRFEHMFARDFVDSCVYKHQYTN